MKKWGMIALLAFSMTYGNTLSAKTVDKQTLKEHVNKCLDSKNRENCSDLYQSAVALAEPWLEAVSQIFQDCGPTNIPCIIGKVTDSASPWQVTCQKGVGEACLIPCILGSTSACNELCKLPGVCKTLCDKGYKQVCPKP